MAKLIKGYYKDGVWHEYGGKLYNTIGYNTNGSMTQKAISDTLGGVLELISGYSMAIRVHGDASVTNLNPFYFVTDGESFTITITYNQPAIALNVISIIMDGTDITQEAYQDGVISIDRVTGNVVITVETASVTNTNMFTSRTTADGITLINNKAKLVGIRGNTLVWRNLGGEHWFKSSGRHNWGGTTYYSNIVDNIDGVEYTVAKDFTGMVALNNNSINNIPGPRKYAKADVYLETNVQSPHFGISWNTSSTSVNEDNNSKHDTQRVANEWFEVSLYNSVESRKSIMEGVRNFGTRWFLYNNGDRLRVKIKNFSIFNLTSIFGAGNEPANESGFKKFFPLGFYDYSESDIILNNKAASYVSKDENENTLQTLTLNLTTLTGKLNGSGESVIIFPDGLKSSCNESLNDTYDEIKQVDGVWKAFKRIGDTRGASANAISKRVEYDILSEEEVYVLDDQTIPTELTVATGGTEEILPVNGTTPTTAPAIMEIQYGAIPSRGLLGGLLGGTKGGGSDEPDYSDGEEITDYEEEQETNEDSDEPIVEEPQEDENEEEPKEDIKESPVIDEKQELKK